VTPRRCAGEGACALGAGFAEVGGAAHALALLQFEGRAALSAGLWTLGAGAEAAGAAGAGYARRVRYDSAAARWVSFAVLGAEVAALELAAGGRMRLRGYALARAEGATPEVSAVADAKLAALKEGFGKKRKDQSETDRAHLAALSARITRHLAGEEVHLAKPLPALPAPPGPPIGSMGQSEECWHCGS
jgi:hypothetical protein